MLSAAVDEGTDVAHAWADPAGEPNHGGRTVE